MKKHFKLVVSFLVIVLYVQLGMPHRCAVPAYASNVWMPVVQERYASSPSVLSAVVFAGTCGLLAYSLPGAIGFSIGMSLVMREISIISFDIGLVSGILMAALLRWPILPLFARRGLFPKRKEITLILEVPILFTFGLVIILVTELTRMFT